MHTAVACLRLAKYVHLHLCKQGKEFQKILDVAGIFRPIVGAVIGDKWKILGVTISGPHEAFVDVEEVSHRP